MMGVVGLSWTAFPAIWVLGNAGLISLTLEKQLYSWSDFAAKMVATSVLMHGSNVSADVYYRRRHHTLLETERSRVGALQIF
eukprot:CAMPEP_0119394620 /NCGR_PEP_ID=MMETSP1334-20130426/130122_1 /TAXON_ID=127549 /ORGANISM="Calcidiscus leptoporus, Strain RCC1130" /LENGTH=81 /DNA_ID=CAMNT_0007417927 /DNA_START=30 /DNA_END=272 /DNA_ORIENTATION=+